VRFVSGGLRFVQAKGFLVEGQAQVSMNLTNFERTPLHRVQEMVRREASRHGLSITKAELIGLIPQSALIDSAKWYLQLDGMQEDQVLEIRLAQEEGQDTTPSEFLEATADTTPTPGGGSAAALAGAVAASLTQMVAGLTEGRKKYADHQEEVVEIRAKAIELRRELTDAIHEDAAAFDRLMSAYRVKDLEQSARAELIEHATIGAAEVPLRVARLSRDVAQLAQSVTRLGNVNAVTDSASAAIMARAAVQAAALNVKVNVVGLRDQAMAQRLRTEVEALEAELDMLATETVSTAAERGKF
jgi:glutamate formiminotransferase/formiminotetrahydrofolate cyclodeaminase